VHALRFVGSAFLLELLQRAKMGRGDIKPSAVTFDDMYADNGDDIEDMEFEAANPLVEEEEEDDVMSMGTDEEDLDLNAEVEELPEGIAAPAGDPRSNLKRKKRESKRRSKSRSKRSSSKRSSTDRRSNERRQRSESVLEEHELIENPHGALDEDDLDLNDDEVDDLIVKSPGSWWNPSKSLDGLGGGAMSWLVIAMLFFPAFIINLFSGVHYATFGQLLFIPFVTYVFLSIPVFFGWAFAFGLRYFGPLNGYPFKIGALSLYPWIKDNHIHARLVVQDAAFGNPPGFPFENFVSAGRVDLEAKFSFAHFLNLLRGKKEKVPLRKVPDFERYIKFDFNHVEVSDAMCNFQMFDGKFNINEFTRILANGEVQAVLKRDSFPNQLRVRVLRARNLGPLFMKKTCDPYVVVRARRQAFETHTQTKTINPMWNEAVYLHVDDASVVIEVAVYDREAPEGTQRALIGHWAMTCKYLVTNPSFCWHYEKEFVSFKKGSRRSEDNATGFRGWVPLATKKWKKMGLQGQMELEVLWMHVPEDEIVNPYVPRRRYTALEQLTMQSQQDQLRFGDWARVRDWLNHEPFSFDIRRFTVRGTRFYLQDLFRGHKGAFENIVLSESTMDGVDCVRLPFLEMRKQFRPKGGDEGITSYDAFIGFFIGLMTSAARSGRLGNAVAQILTGGVLNFGSRFRSLLRGDFERGLVPIRGHQITSVAKLAKSGIQVMHQNVTKNRRNRAQFKIAVDADDTDFLSDKVELSGHLDRCAMKASSDISPREMAAMAKKRGNFKTKYFELKGDTIFYRKHDVIPKGVTYNLTYKINLDTVFGAIYVKSANELLLNIQEANHVVRLREPANVSSDQLVVKLRKWIQVLKEHDIPHEEFD